MIVCLFKEVESFTDEDEALLVQWDTLLVLDIGLPVLDVVRSLHLEREGCPKSKRTTQMPCSALAKHTLSMRMVDATKGEGIRKAGAQ